MAQEHEVVTADEARPASLTWALRALLALIAFGAVVVALIVIRHDDLLRVWAEGNPSARRILETKGLEAIKHPGEYDIKPPHFVAPALTLYGVIASLVAVIMVYLRNGFEWARVVLTLLLAFTAVASIGGIMTGPPFLFVVLTVIEIAIGAVAVVFMWMPATTRYIHPRAGAEVERLREHVGL